MNNLKVFFKTMGCKVNSFDSAALGNLLEESGFVLVSDYLKAEIIIINTCVVTEKAEKEALYLVRRFKRENPSSLLVLIGCYAQTDSDRLIKLEDIDLVVPNECKSDLLDLLQNKILNKNIDKFPENILLNRQNKSPQFISKRPFFGKISADRTRAFVKIQDGCDGFCSYCIVPFARGNSVSVSRELIIDEIKRLINIEIKEIVLTGVHIGNYGKRQLPSLLEEICKIDGCPRLRLSSIEITDFSEECLEILRENKKIICDHFHIPLQSGSDRILTLMERKYDGKCFLKTLEKIRQTFPRANIGSDIIVGFPTETDQDFTNTVDLIKRSNLNYLHVFPFSSRPNTKASLLSPKVSKEKINNWAKELRQISSELEKSYLRSYLRQEVEVLWENDLDKKGRQKGTTKNYLSVVAGSAEALRPGTISKVIVSGILSDNIATVIPRC